MQNRTLKTNTLFLFVGAIVGLSQGVSANTALTPGVWTNITPSNAALTAAYGMTSIAVDPANPSTIYTQCEGSGGYKSVDEGSTWTPFATFFGTDAFGIFIDPKNPLRMYASRGVRGSNLGFWFSSDGGTTWTKRTMPTGTSDDIGFVAIDPTDFNHVLIGSHSPWTGISNAGVIESFDAGVTTVKHMPDPSWGSGTMGVNFLYCPEQGIGNAQTWLIGTDGEGQWRTTNSGTTWTRQTPTGVWPDFSCSHGGERIYYAKTGVLYSGAAIYPIRSTDNGVTWTSITNNMSYAYYYAVMGDGNNLYTCNSFADNTAKYNAAYKVSPETDGVNWKEYNPLGTGSQKFDNGPYEMAFDKVNRIMYSANWCAGVWALKVVDPGTSVEKKITASASRSTLRNSAITRIGRRIEIQSARGTWYDVNGRALEAGQSRVLAGR